MTEDEKTNRDHKKYVAKFEGYIFFDYEAYRKDDGTHEPNLVIARKICKNCLDVDTRCNSCQEIHKFWNNEDFCHWLLKQHDCIALAHNLKAYDGVFIANYCINTRTSGESYPEMIATTSKLLQIKFRRLKIIDSYSFLAMGLDKFPKTFNLPELKKGFYPHGFNKPEFASYVGRFPDKSYYGSEFFSNAKKAEFDAFYEANKDKIFDQKKELEEYCISDVYILTEGCLKFRKIIMDSTKRLGDKVGIDPFQVSKTIASLCNHIFRRNYMEPKSIAIIPDNGYNPKQKTSKKCERWLDYVSKTSIYNGFLTVVKSGLAITCLTVFVQITKPSTSSTDAIGTVARNATHQRHSTQRKTAQ